MQKLCHALIGIVDFLAANLFKVEVRMNHIVVIIVLGPNAEVLETADVVQPFVMKGTKRRRNDKGRRHGRRQLAKKGRRSPFFVTAPEKLVEIPLHFLRRKSRFVAAVFLTRGKGTGKVEEGID